MTAALRYLVRALRGPDREPRGPDRESEGLMFPWERVVLVSPLGTEYPATPSFPLSEVAELLREIHALPEAPR